MQARKFLHHILEFFLKSQKYKFWMVIKRNEVNLVKKTEIKERKISFKRIETWIPKQEQQPNTGSSIERAAAKREQFQ